MPIEMTGGRMAYDEGLAGPMDFNGEPMKGFLFVSPEGFETDPDLERWVGYGLSYAASLPAKSRHGDRGRAGAKVAVRARLVVHAALLAALAGAPALAASSELADGQKLAGGCHLIYLHGRIVQDQQSARPKHPEWGYYELEAILATLRARGFEVTGEIRPKANSVSQSADHVVRQVKGLIASGIPPGRITVVGGSMGAAIALLASVRLQNPELRFAVLGACMSRSVPALVDEHGGRPAGRFLAFLERSDELSEPCPPWSDTAAGATRLAVREIVLHTGEHHGFLYRPLPEWVDPLVQWARQD